MPAAAVIPAPIAYIKVVADKKLVVELLTSICLAVISSASLHSVAMSYLSIASLTLICGTGLCSSFTVRKLECSKQAIADEYISME